MPFYKTRKRGHPEHLYILIPVKSSFYNTRKSYHIETYYCRTVIFKYSFFPYVILKWNRLHQMLRNSNSCGIFTNSLLQIDRTVSKPKFNMHNPVRLKLLTRLRLRVSHLNENRFNHNFKDCINPHCSCSLEVESTSHFFLHCHNFVNIRNNLFNKLNSINC